jgi:hypothetical protein
LEEKRNSDEKAERKKIRKEKQVRIGDVIRTIKRRIGGTTSNGTNRQFTSI